MVLLSVSRESSWQAALQPPVPINTHKGAIGVFDAVGSSAGSTLKSAEASRSETRRQGGPKAQWEMTQGNDDVDGKNDDDCDIYYI